MKKYIALVHLSAALLFTILTGCSDDDNPADNQGTDYDYSSILNDYTEKVIITTYADLDEQAAALQAACETLKENTTQANLDAAVEKWKTARAAWEASEAFLFGPVSFLSLDPSLDTWPLDQSQLETVLNSDFQLTPDFIRNGLGYSLRGFHTIEYLLFESGQNRNASALTERQKEYLVSCAVVLAEDASTLHSEWTGSFGNEFKKAGSGGSRYSSQTQAVLEIVEGITTIADEVGNGKIAEPYTTKDVQTVESQFSWNSLTDFTNNIKSIKNAYLGAYNGDGSGLDDFVKSKDDALNTRILAEIDETIEAIGAIPYPFRNNLNADAQIQAAINACNKLHATFESDIKALITE
jgi:uncharacterized iron-regulated protein